MDIKSRLLEQLQGSSAWAKTRILWWTLIYHGTWPASGSHMLLHHLALSLLLQHPQAQQSAGQIQSDQKFYWMFHRMKFSQKRYRILTSLAPESNHPAVVFHHKAKKSCCRRVGSGKFPLFSFAGAVTRTESLIWVYPVSWTQKATFSVYFPCRLACLTFLGREEGLLRTWDNTETAAQGR